MNYELNNLYESFMHKIDKVKDAKEHDPFGNMRHEIDKSFAGVQFECEALGDFLQNKYNKGKYFSQKEAEECPIVLNKDLVKFEEDFCDGPYSFNELKFFPLATTEGSANSEFEYPHPNLITETTIPFSWTKIPDKMFFYFKSLEKISLSAKIVSIGDMTFSKCSNLESIELPEHLQTIGNSCFFGCTNLDELILPNSVTHLGSALIEDCDNLYEITLPASISDININDVFSSSHLEELKVPSTVNRLTDNSDNPPGYGKPEITNLYINSEMIDMDKWDKCFYQTHFWIAPELKPFYSKFMPMLEKVINGNENGNGNKISYRKD